ncbi:hypothetical protein ACRAWB_05960 [Leifsonia poae]|uniref:hypothetical protein n=1 Tax=Leifsonia poae TaxID=110933 RepID=UPI003D68273C
MTTVAYDNDVRRLADALMEVSLDLPPLESATLGVFILDLHIRTTDLRVVNNLNGALQIAFDAAAIAALGEEALAPGEDIRLDLLWGASGSWREAIIVHPLNQRAREALGYIVPYAIQALASIQGVPPSLPLGLGAIFAGTMLVSMGHDVPITVELETVDAHALSEASVIASTYPPGRAWSPAKPAAKGNPNLAHLGDYLKRHPDRAHFSVSLGPRGQYEVALVVDDQVPDQEQAEVIAKWLAEKNGLVLA